MLLASMRRAGFEKIDRPNQPMNASRVYRIEKDAQGLGQAPSEPAPAMIPVDPALFERAAAGNREAFWSLILPFRGLIYSVALGILHNHERAEDQLHDVLIQACHSLGRLRRPEKLASWLYTITHHHVMDTLRREQRHYKALPQVVQHTGAIGNGAEQGPKEAQLRHMEHALGELPEPFRLILALKYVNNCPYQEIAEILDLPYSTVKSRLFEARRLLRGLMERESASQPGALGGTPHGTA
jgi:RNA polymerase sigma-70 factor, ECF subfamily